MVGIGFKSRRPDQISQRLKDNQPPEGGVLESIWSPKMDAKRSTRCGSLTNASGPPQKRSRHDDGSTLAESRLLLDGAGLPTCPAPRDTCLEATCSNRGPKPSRHAEPCYPLDRPHVAEEAVALS